MPVPIMHRLQTFTDTHTIQIHLGTLEISMTNDADPALVAETLKLLQDAL